MSEFKWEKLTSQCDEFYWFGTYRAKVDGGWLYRTWDFTNDEGVKSTSESMVFVPESQQARKIDPSMLNAFTPPSVSQDNELSVWEKYMAELKKNDNRISELFDVVAKLSLKLNTMQSDLRDFEKQRHNALIERVNQLEGKMLEKYCDAYERIEKLEARLNWKPLDYPLPNAIPCSNVSDTPYKPAWLPGESPLPQSAPDHEHRFRQRWNSDKYECTICGADGGKNVGIKGMLK